jgi:hypothetical protein
MSAPSAHYYLLGGHFDLSSQIKQEAPPYIPDPLLPAYNLKAVSHTCPLSLSPPSPLISLPANFPCSRCLMSALRQRLIPRTLSEPARATPVCTLITAHCQNAMLMHHHSHPAGLRGFDLAESIWSQESDLTLDDLALESDSVSGRSHSSTSSRWSAAPQTPLTSLHRQLPPTQEHAPPSEPIPIPGHSTATATPPDTAGLPESPAPAYSLDPLEFDPVLLASLDPQLLSRPFEAFEDVLWACFPDSPPAHDSYTFRSLNASLSQIPTPTAQASFTAHTSFSEASMAALVSPGYPLPPLLPPPPPAYPTSKPLPNLPPPSPRSSAGHLQPSQTPVAMPFESFVLEDPYPTSPPGETVQFFPLRAPVRARSKSVGGTKPVRRLTGAIARLRGRE